MSDIFYGIYSEKLKEIEQRTLSEVQAILDSVSTDSETALAEHVKCRIKSGESAKEKLERNGFPVTALSALTNLTDVIGLRVVTHFVGDIYTVLDRIGKNPEWEVVRIKDYIASPKPNGYRSLHVLFKVPFGFGGLETITAEIQLRTIAMDCWASLEHQLRYKKNIRNSALIGEELKRCADEMASTDLTMQTIRDMIRR